MLSGNFHWHCQSQATWSFCFLLGTPQAHCSNQESVPAPRAPSILPLDFLSPTTAFYLLNPWFSSPQFQISERENLFGLTGLMLTHSLLIYSSHMVEPMTQAQMSGCNHVPRWAHLCFHDLSIDGRDVHWCLLGPVRRESPGSTHYSPSGWFTSFCQSTTVRDSAWWK